MSDSLGPHGPAVSKRDSFFRRATSIMSAMIVIFVVQAVVGIRQCQFCSQQNVVAVMSVTDSKENDFCDDFSFFGS